jgi:hypothetical protein
MKPINPDAPYAKDINRFSFDDFMQCFHDCYDPNDYEVLKIFLPIAKIIHAHLIAPENLLMEDDRTKILTTLKSDMPLDIKLILASPIKTMSMTKRLTAFIGDNFVSPKLSKSLRDMDADKRIHKNKKYQTKEFIFNDRNVTEKKIKLKAGYRYDFRDDTINIDPDYTINDTLALLHELSHSVTCGVGDNLLCEIPSVLTEFAAEKMTSSAGINFGDVKVNYFSQMQNSTKPVIDLCTAFGFYEKHGFLTNKILKTVIGVDKPYHFTDINAFHNMLYESKYFIGAAAAFVHENKINTPEDLENFYTNICEDGITPEKKLKRLNINTATIGAAVSNFLLGR